MKHTKDIIEKRIFGVCGVLSERLGIRISTVRLYFIYLSFVTFGSPIVFYLFAAFWMNIKYYLFRTPRMILD